MEIPIWLKPKSTGAIVLLWVAGLLFAVLFVWWMLFYAPAPAQESLDAALTTLEEEVSAAPQDPAKRLAVAIAYAARDLHTEAVEQFEQALLLEPENQTALIGIGRSLAAVGKEAEALEVFLKIIEMNLDNPVMNISEQIEAVFYDMASIYYNQGEYANAITSLNKALEINPVDADAWLQLGRSQAADGQMQQSLVSFLRSVRLVPNYIEAYQEMGYVFEQMESESGVAYATGMIYVSGRNYDPAVAELEKAVQGLPDMATAFEGLALAYEGTGNVEAALASYERALDLEPSLILSQQGLLRMQAAQ